MQSLKFLKKFSKNEEFNNYLGYVDRYKLKDSSAQSLISMKKKLGMFLQKLVFLINTSNETDEENLKLMLPHYSLLFDLSILTSDFSCNLLYDINFKYHRICEVLLCVHNSHLLFHDPSSIFLKCLQGLDNKQLQALLLVAALQQKYTQLFLTHKQLSAATLRFSPSKQLVPHLKNIFKSSSFSSSFSSSPPLTSDDPRTWHQYLLKHCPIHTIHHLLQLPVQLTDVADLQSSPIHHYNNNNVCDDGEDAKCVDTEDHMSKNYENNKNKKDNINNDYDSITTIDNKGEDEEEAGDAGLDNDSVRNIIVVRNCDKDGFLRDGGGVTNCIGINNNGGGSGVLGEEMEVDRRGVVSENYDGGSGDVVGELVENGDLGGKSMKDGDVVGDKMEDGDVVGDEMEDGDVMEGKLDNCGLDRERKDDLVSYEGKSDEKKMSEAGVDVKGVVKEVSSGLGGGKEVDVGGLKNREIGIIKAETQNKTESELAHEDKKISMEMSHETKGSNKTTNIIDFSAFNKLQSIKGTSKHVNGPPKKDESSEEGRRLRRRRTLIGCGEVTPVKMMKGLNVRCCMNATKNKNNEGISNNIDKIDDKDKKVDDDNNNNNRKDNRIDNNDTRRFLRSRKVINYGEVNLVSFDSDENEDARNNEGKNGEGTKIRDNPGNLIKVGETPRKSRRISKMCINNEVVASMTNDEGRSGEQTNNIRRVQVIEGPQDDDGNNNRDVNINNNKENKNNKEDVNINNNEGENIDEGYKCRRSLRRKTVENNEILNNNDNKDYDVFKNSNRSYNVDNNINNKENKTEKDNNNNNDANNDDLEDKDEGTQFTRLRSSVCLPRLHTPQKLKPIAEELNNRKNKNDVFFNDYSFKFDINDGEKSDEDDVRVQKSRQAKRRVSTSSLYVKSKINKQNINNKEEIKVNSKDFLRDSNYNCTNDGDTGSVDSVRHVGSRGAIRKSSRIAAQKSGHQ